MLATSDWCSWFRPVPLVASAKRSFAAVAAAKVRGQ
jgi:hypothetical protein